MNILVINDLVVGGGVESVMYHLVEHLCKKDKVTLVSILDQSEGFYGLYSENVKYVPYFLKKIRCSKFQRYSFRWFFYIFIEKVRFIWLRIKKYDMVLALKEGDAMKLGLKFRAKERYAWVHADYRLLYWTEYCFDGAEDEVECMRKYNKVTCVSNAVKESVCQVIGDPGNLCVKFNPIDVNSVLERSEGEVRELTEYLRVRDDKPVLITVGRLCEHKGYRRLMEACIKLNKEFDYELWILGEGEMRDEMESMIYENKLDNVIIWGNQENPFPFIKCANWFVSASLGESYGLALQEALILGVPILATSCPAFEECLAKEEAILVSNDGEALYEGLYRILKDRSLETTYRRNIHTRTSEDFFTGRLDEIEKLWRIHE